MPDAAFEPIYQTWCAYHREITDDFAAHVKRLHEKGLKVALWFPMALFTDDCPIADAFRPYMLYRTSWAPYVWDPRFAARRDYILACLERAVRDWKVDGLKLDFGRETGRIDIPQGVSSVRIPRAGRIVVDAAIGSCR